MTDEGTETGLAIETAPGEVLAHVRGETALPCRILDGPAAERIVALRERVKEGDGGGERTPVWIVPPRPLRR